MFDEGVGGVQERGGRDEVLMLEHQTTLPKAIKQSGQGRGQVHVATHAFITPTATSIKSHLGPLLPLMLGRATLTTSARHHCTTRGF